MSWGDGGWNYGARLPTPFRPARTRTRYFLKPPKSKQEEHQEIKTFIRRIPGGESFGVGYVAEHCACSPVIALKAINQIRENSIATLECLGFGIYRWL
jgi:hypothetical protein